MNLITVHCCSQIWFIFNCNGQPHETTNEMWLDRRHQPNTFENNEKKKKKTGLILNIQACLPQSQVWEHIYPTSWSGYLSYQNL